MVGRGMFGRLSSAFQGENRYSGGWRRFGLPGAHREGTAVDDVGLAENHAKAKTGKSGDKQKKRLRGSW